MNIFRTVSLDGFRPGEQIGRKAGRRLPSNVPYMIDNLWEFTRPAGMPSRRHAVYASPTPELARANASAHAPGGYLDCRIEFREPPFIYQLPVKDAREHADVETLQRFVSRRLGDWSAIDVAGKLALAPLFLPGITRDELWSAMQAYTLLREVVEGAAEKVTFWQADQASVSPDGEMFFELAEGNTYTLHPV